MNVLKIVAIAAFGPQAAVDLMQMTILDAEWVQKKLVCCECFKGECHMCGYKN